MGADLYKLGLNDPFNTSINVLFWSPVSCVIIVIMYSEHDGWQLTSDINHLHKVSKIQTNYAHTRCVSLFCPHHIAQLWCWKTHNNLRDYQLTNCVETGPMWQHSTASSVFLTQLFPKVTKYRLQCLQSSVISLSTDHNKMLFPLSISVCSNQAARSVLTNGGVVSFWSDYYPSRVQRTAVSSAATGGSNQRWAILHWPPS